MTTAILLIAAVLAQFIAQSPATPVMNEISSSHPLLARSDFCDNAPGTVAGTLLNHRTLLPRSHTLQTRVLNSARWCARESATYVLITYGYQVAGDAVPYMLTDAYNTVVRQIADVGDGLIPTGVWWYTGFGMKIIFQNGNNHQQTWGVIGAAMSALLDYTYYMARREHPAAVSFLVYDGQHQVGFGSIMHA